MPRFTLFLLALLTAATLCAQEQPHTTQTNPRQQIAVAGGLTVTRKTTAGGIKFEPTSAAAYEFSYRYRLMRHISVQADYDFNRNTQKYLVGSQLTSIGSDVHAITGNAVFTFANPLSKRFESFVSVGGGALLFEPRNQGSQASQVVNHFSLGGGDDLLLTPHLRLRAQVKGLMYQAPDFGLSSIHRDKFVSTVIPTLGIVYSF
jgi:hypothetical protein